jgi:3-oxoadipate enol-lactonase
VKYPAASVHESYSGRYRWMETSGVTLRYQYRRGVGPTLVLLHELGGSLESWDEVIDLLPPTVPVLRFDLRGAGMSEKIVGSVSLKNHVDDLHGLLKALDINTPLALVGLAVGAAVAASYALTWPASVSHYVGLAPAFGVAADARVGALLWAQELARSGLRPAGENVLDKAFPVPLRTDPATFAKYRSRWLGTDPRSLGAMFEMLANMTIGDELRLLPGRSLLVAGTFDTFRPPAEVERLGRLAPHAEVIHVPSGHLMVAQSPRLIATLLARYIGSQERGRDICQGFLAKGENLVGDVGHAA